MRIISLRWHYPNQVSGRNILSFLSAGWLPAPLLCFKHLNHIFCYYKRSFERFQWFILHYARLRMAIERVLNISVCFFLPFLISFFFLKLFLSSFLLLRFFWACLIVLLTVSRTSACGGFFSWNACCCWNPAETLSRQRSRSSCRREHK